LHGGREANLNLKGAWLHVLTDTLGSVGALVAAALIWGWGWRWADPAASGLIGLLVMYSAWHLLAESTSVLLESAPRGIDVDDVRRSLQETPGVMAVHDLHIWTITSGLDCLSAHVIVEDVNLGSTLLKSLRQCVHRKFGIDHVTIQLEPQDFDESQPQV
jgi:cobalt-zinc-cadmium efflux system protein